MKDSLDGYVSDLRGVDVMQRVLTGAVWSDLGRFPAFDKSGSNLTES
jgi:hypothetical protein